MSATVEFNITVFDEASGVFSNVRSNASECFRSVKSRHRTSTPETLLGQANA